MKRDRDNLRRLIREAGLAQFEDYLMRAARPSIRVSSTRVDNEDSIPGGASKLGGRPDLPRGVNWPQVPYTPERTGSLPFIAQINLSDVKQYDEENLLPERGILYFFDSYHPVAQKDQGRVIFFDGDFSMLERAHFPADLPPTEPQTWGEYRFAPCTVTFTPEVNLPFHDADCTEPDYSPEQSDAYTELLYQASYNRPPLDRTVNRLLGYNYDVVDDMQLDAQIIAHGITHLAFLLTPKEKEFHVPRARDWTLLLQLDSDANTNMMWGDAGVLCFYIHRDDLKNRDFSRVVALEFSG